MLEAYKKTHGKTVIQYILLDDNGNVLESDNAFIPINPNTSITEINPFFITVIDLLEQKDKQFNFSCVHLNANQQEFIVDITLKTIKNQPSLIIIQNLTNHYSSYQHTAQMRNESVINSQVLELKNEYLKEKEEFKNNFIANFSHEIREPISGIRSFINILNKTSLTSEQQDYINIVNSSARHLYHMIEDILDISKIEAGKLRLVEEPFVLKDFLDEIIFKYKIKTKEKGLEFNYSIDENLPNTIIGDKFRLKQILDNLIENAIKFTNKGEIKLKVSLNQIRANKVSINFQIKDTGIGISNENKNKVFESFIQLNENTNQTKGTGLGLAIVKHLVELMHGNITLEDNATSGTKINVNLNFKIELAAKRKNIAKEKPKQKLALKPNKKYNILLVEDSEITQLAILKIVASQGKGQLFLDIINNPNDVIPTLQNQKVDLILLDIGFQAISGDEIAKQIRQLEDKELRKVPIIAITGRVYPEDLKSYKKAKINDVIKKPFNNNVLIEKIIENLN